MRTDILDHGYVEFIEHWGSDERIVEAARMSTAKGFLGWGPLPCPVCAKLDTPDAVWVDKACKLCKGEGVVPGDEKLLARLWNDKHATPFEMAGLTIEVQAPIFVFREWHRHRTQSYNELSARYTPIPDVNYIPTIERLMVNANTTNRQANRIADAPPLSPFHARAFQINLEKSYRGAEAQYQTALADGVPKELARCFLPVGRYSRMRASANLRNWLAFLTLRMDAAAQWEIRQYANVVAGLVRETFPRTYELFIK